MHVLKMILRAFVTLQERKCSSYCKVFKVTFFYLKIAENDLFFYIKYAHYSTYTNQLP